LPSPVAAKLLAKPDGKRRILYSSIFLAKTTLKPVRNDKKPLKTALKFSKTVKNLQKFFIFLHFGAGQQYPEGVFDLKTHFFLKITQKKWPNLRKFF
jgi:hypothetical protein